MMNNRKICLIVNKYKSSLLPVAESLVKDMKAKGINIFLHSSDNPEPEELRSSDLVISFGGDGTVLYTTRLVASYGIPVLAVNMGKVGFITEIDIDNLEDALRNYFEGKCRVVPRNMIRVTIYRGGKLLCDYTALNDCVISSGGMSKVIELGVNVSGQSLGDYRADGIIISTPTGSTAYSLAAGGPILHPDMDAFLLTPICPYSLSNRPLVLHGEDTVTVQIKHKQNTHVNMTVDGQEILPLEDGDELILKRSEIKALFIKATSNSFYNIVRTKLGWSGGVNA